VAHKHFFSRFDPQILEVAHDRSRLLPAPIPVFYCSEPNLRSMCTLQTVSGFLLCGTFLDIAVWYYVKDLEIYDKETETDSTRKGKKSEKNRRKWEEQ
jgi:hypothetical protein